MSSFEALDESKPFDLIYTSSKGIKYHQEGRYFNARKELVDSKGEPIVSPEASKTAPKTTAEVIEAAPRENPVDTGRRASGQFKSTAEKAAKPARKGATK
jgi:hypothetical protein